MSKPPKINPLKDPDSIKHRDFLTPVDPTPLRQRSHCPQLLKLELELKGTTSIRDIDLQGAETHLKQSKHLQAEGGIGFYEPFPTRYNETKQGPRRAEKKGIS